MAKAAPPVRTIEDLSEVDYLVTEYVHLRAQEKDIKPRKEILRNELMKVIENVGEYDADGNQFMELPVGLEAGIIMRQRRTKRAVNFEAAQRILAAKGMEDEAFILVPQLDEDYVMRQVFEGKISDAELEEIFPTEETFALVVK